ncbi:MAG: RluA family pseudouridine synthase [Cellvibrionaceae bacterium]|nr:RluA family pseudouridine synthase [Cellvibrionaceae bacterium]
MLDILYEDEHLVAVAKPENLLCVPGLSEPDNLFDRLRGRYPNARVVHRLDMATSGAILFALDHASQKSLGQQFERRLVDKRYSAVVSGHVAAVRGEIVMPLICDWPNRPRQKVDWLQGKPAHTLFEVKRHLLSGQTLLELTPLTGRSHQLRVHCQQLGHPIMGDELYNLNPAGDRLMLHAERIEIDHPISGHRLKIYCPSPFI